MLALTRELAALVRARALAWTMTRREIAARYAGTAAGGLWAYAQPLLTVAAYYLVFDVVFAMRLGENAPTPRVGAYLIVGALPWMAFCDALSRGMSSLVDAGGILQKNALPPVLFPARAVLASALVHAPLALALALAYAPLHRFAWALSALLPLLVLQWLLAFLLAYLLAIVAAALRDTLQLVGFVLSVGIFVSPVLFPITLFPEGWRWVLWANPMTSIVSGYQSVLLQGAWPAGSVWLAAVGWIVLAAVLLNLAIARSRDQLVDWL